MYFYYLEYFSYLCTRLSIEADGHVVHHSPPSRERTSRRRPNAGCGRRASGIHRMNEKKDMKSLQESEVKYGFCQKSEELMQSLDAAASQLTADDVAYLERVEQCQIVMDKYYAPKEFILKVNSIPTLSIGDIHMVQAQAKQGKTTLATILVAACLCGKFGVVEYALDRDIKIALFDTEQFEYDTFIQYRNMLSMGSVEGEDFGRLIIYNLRRYGYEERLQFIKDVIMREKPQFVIIDGLRDLIPDINDPVGCPMLVQEMMQLASEAGCAILGVLHNNPGEGKARGWLGTEWINKCGYSFELEKNGSVVTVKTPINRGAPVPDWQFTFGPDGRPTCDSSFLEHRMKIDNEKIKAEKARNQAIEDDKYIEPINNVLWEQGKPMTKTSIANILSEKKIVGSTKALEIINRLLDREECPFSMVGTNITIKRESTGDKIF